MKLRSASSAEKNFPDEITWLTWKTEQNLEIWPFLNSRLEMWVWESGRKIDPATGVIKMSNTVASDLIRGSTWHLVTISRPAHHARATVRWDPYKINLGFLFSVNTHQRTYTIAQARPDNIRQVEDFFPQLRLLLVQVYFCRCVSIYNGKPRRFARLQTCKGPRKEFGTYACVLRILSNTNCARCNVTTEARRKTILGAVTSSHCWCLARRIHMLPHTHTTTHIPAHTHTIGIYVCIYICTYVHIYIYVNIYTCTHICTYMYIHIYAYMYKCMYIYICAYMHTYTWYIHVKMHVCMHAFHCAYICTYVYMYVCLYAWIYASMFVCVYVYCMFVCLCACIDACKYQNVRMYGNIHVYIWYAWTHTYTFRMRACESRACSIPPTYINVQHLRTQHVYTSTPSVYERRARVHRWGAAQERVAIMLLMIEQPPVALRIWC